MSANLNATANGTQRSSCASPGDRAAENIGKTVAYSSILVVSLDGNLLIGIIVCKTKTMRRTINYLIVNMAVSDLLFPIFVFPAIITDMNGGSWFFNSQAFCKMVMLLQYLSSLVSIESMVLIAVDRFEAVVFPLAPPIISSKRCLFLILASWIVASALSVPTFFAYKPVEFTGQFRCSWRWKEAPIRYYNHGIRIVFAAISFAFIVILYSIILFKLKSQKIPGEQSANSEEQRARRQRNVVKMAIAIVSGFALCWGPVTVYSFLNVFVWSNTIRLSCSITFYKGIAQLIGLANCALNPCICFTFSGNYRQGLKRLLGCYGGNN